MRTRRIADVVHAYVACFFRLARRRLLPQAQADLALDQARVLEAALARGAFMAPAAPLESYR